MRLRLESRDLVRASHQFWYNSRASQDAVDEVDVGSRHDGLVVLEICGVFPGLNFGDILFLFSEIAALFRRFVEIRRLRTPLFRSNGNADER